FKECGQGQGRTVGYGGIVIRPFRHEFGDVVFGLVIETFEGRQHAELHPNRLGLYEPWDGSYDA
ncbi:hypothetical protein ACWDUI_28685, partial [Streptosporangium sandarakinum]